MDKDRVNGGVEQAKGRVQKAAGDLTGDSKLKARGTVNEAKGKAQKTVGEAKDAVRKATK